MKTQARIRMRTLFLITLFLLINFCAAYPQTGKTITGRLLDEKTGQPVSYASISLYSTEGHQLLKGTLSDNDGQFVLPVARQGQYSIVINFLGYKQVSRDIEIKDNTITDLGSIIMSENVIKMADVEVVGEKIRAKAENNKTSYFITQKISSVANTGIDVLKYIPGIQVDLMHNISLEGKNNIMIFVDGKERDRSYISQLMPSQIEKIEVINVATANLDGNVSGAINIVLKKDLSKGLSGQVYAEVPLTSKLVYMFPKYSLNYSNRKLNLYTSYSGDIMYLNLNEKLDRVILSENGNTIYTTSQTLRQKDWSHRFDYGADYYFSTNDMISISGYIDPFSRELDGTSQLAISGTTDKTWNTTREDEDMNLAATNSLFYKHTFSNTANQLTVDISDYSFRGKTISDYVVSGEQDGNQPVSNISKPWQNTASLRSDLSLSIKNNLNFNGGIKVRYQKIDDKSVESFSSNEKVYAMYGTFSFRKGKTGITLGARGELSENNISATDKKSYFNLLPDAAVRYKINDKQNLQLSYSSRVERPRLYQLNPNPYYDDPYTVTQGNISLMPQIYSNLNLEYSLQFSGNYISAKTFYARATNVLDYATYIDNESRFVTMANNLGTFSQYGVQISGSLKAGLFIFSPYFRVYDLEGHGNSTAALYNIPDRSRISYETALSVIASFRHDISASAVFQYNSRVNNIQNTRFSDPLYFVSLEKTFKKGFRVGFGGGLMFTRSFVYNGYTIDAGSFSSHYTGNVNVPSFPFWIKLGYSFNNGKARAKNDRHGEDISSVAKKGF